MENNKKTTPTFPMVMHGIEVNNREEARIVIDLYNGDQLRLAAIKREKQILGLMSSPSRYTREEAEFLVDGGVPGGSVSSML